MKKLLHTLLLFLFAIGIKAQTPYAIWTEGNRTLTFDYSTDEYNPGDTYNGKTITAVWSGKDITETTTTYYDDSTGEYIYLPVWNKTVKGLLTYVVFTKSFAQVKPTNLNFWFYSCTKLTSIEGIQYLNTSKVTSMREMFQGCSSLTSLDVSHFDTSNVTEMESMFQGCSSLTSLDVSHFDTSNVKYMGRMFQGCSGLTSIDVSHFDTSKVTNMSCMFSSCFGLKNIDVSNFDTSNVTSMYEMFYGCTQLKSLDVSNFDTSNVTTMYYMFTGSGLTSIDLSGFDTSNVTDMRYMFHGCTNLASIDVSSFDTSNVTSMAEMFSFCSGLTSLDLSGFDTSNVTSMKDMFYNCSNLTSLDLSNWDFRKVREDTSIQDFFKNCTHLVDLNLSKTKLNTTSIKICKGIQSLKSVNLSNADLSNETNMNSMFSGCSSLESLDLSSFDTSNATSMAYVFYNCTNLTSLDVSSFDTSNVLNMEQMFYNCKSLTSLDLSNFDTSNVGSMREMFRSCSNLTSINMSSCELSGNSCDLSAMFNACSKLETIYCNYSWDSNGSSGMFYGCENLKGGMAYNSNNTNCLYANPGQSGYFTAIETGEDKNRAIALWCEEIQTLYYLMTDQNYNVGSLYKGEKVTSVWVRSAATTNLKKKCDPKKVVFDSSYAEVRPTNTSNWFSGYNLTSIEGIEYFNTSKVTNMSYMFCSCNSLTSIDLSHFDTSNVTNMSYMFSGCSGLTSLDVSHFDTSNVTNMSYMFSGCSGLTSLDVSNFDTSKVIEISRMFEECSGLTSLDLSKLDTSNITDMDYVFFSCKSLTYVDLSGWNLGKVTKIDGIFHSTSPEHLNLSNTVMNSVSIKICYGISSLKTVDFSNMNTSNVTSMGGMFYNCKSLTSLDLSHFDTSNVTYMGGMFYNCKSLTSLDLSHFDTSNVTYMGRMFEGCSSLTSLDLSHFDTSNVKSMNRMFYDCASLTSLNLSGFNTLKVSDMELMFSNCYDLKTIYCNETWSCDRSSKMFENCSNLVGGNGMRYDARKTDVTYANPGENGYFTSTSPIPASGDVNKDGSVDVADFIATANHILGNTPSSFDAGNADMNSDNSIDVADLIAIANVILHGSNTQGVKSERREIRRLATDISQMDDAIYIEPIEAEAGSQQVLSIKMKNAKDVSGFEFNLQLPEGISVATDEDGFPLVEMSTARTSAKRTNYFDSAFQPDGTLKVLCGTSAADPNTNLPYAFRGNDGEVVRITINIPEGYKGGDYQIHILNGIIAAPNAEKKALQTDITSTLTVKGDEQPENNATDISQLNNALYIDPIEAEAGSQQVLSIKMKNAEDVSGFEFNLQLPEGISVATDEDGFPLVEMSTARTSVKRTNYFDSAFQPDGTLKVLCGTSAADPNTNLPYAFKGNDGEVVRITINIPDGYNDGNYLIHILNGIIAAPNAEKKALQADISSSFKIGSSTSIDGIEATHTINGIYTLQGIYVGEEKDMNRLPKGIYIQNGKKVMVR